VRGGTTGGAHEAPDAYRTEPTTQSNGLR